MGNETAKSKTMKIFVQKDTSVDINKVRTAYKKGLVDAPIDHATILINAGYAQSAEPEKEKGK